MRNVRIDLTVKRTTEYVPSTTMNIRTRAAARSSWRGWGISRLWRCDNLRRSPTRWRIVGCNSTTVHKSDWEMVRWEETIKNSSLAAVDIEIPSDGFVFADKKWFSSDNHASCRHKFIHTENASKQERVSERTFTFKEKQKRNRTREAIYHLLPALLSGIVNHGTFCNSGLRPVASR